MNTLQKPLFVFLLTRRGCWPYALQILHHLSFPQKIFVSIYSPSLTGAQRIRTYRSGTEIVLNSIFILPFFLLKIRRQFKSSCKVAYFPVFHHWNLPLIWWCRLHGVKTIVTIHDGILHTGEDTRLDQWMQDRCIKMADTSIFLTEFVRQTVLERFTPPGSTHVIPHGILPLSSIPETRPHMDHPARLLFLGRIGKYKGLDLLLEALEQLPDDLFGHLTIAGQALYPLSIPENKKVRRVDKRLSEEEMAMLLQNHDVLVLPYLDATQSGILTLGIQAAIPMVITKVGGLPEQLTPQEAVWVEPNADSLAQGISLLLNDPVYYAAVYEKLLEKRKNNQWQNAGDELTGIITELRKQAEK